MYQVFMIAFVDFAHKLKWLWDYGSSMSLSIG